MALIRWQPRESFAIQRERWTTSTEVQSTTW